MIRVYSAEYVRRRYYTGPDTGIRSRISSDANAGKTSIPLETANLGTKHPKDAGLRPGSLYPATILVSS
jgi:hypothetical protein